jgi:hypothetical protein
VTEESKPELARKRAELVEILANARPLPPEDRRRFQDELSIINAKIKALNTSEAIKLKATADQRKAAGMAEARANAARARANAGLSVEEEDDDPGQTKAINAWIIDVLQHQGDLCAAEAKAAAPKKATKRR